VLDTITHKTKDEDKKTTKKQHNMWWTTLYKIKKTKTNKIKNTTQFVLDTTVHKTKKEDQQNK
jgi:predicted transcriptional regulator